MFQRAAQDVLFVPVIRLPPVIHLQRVVGKGVNRCAVYCGYADLPAPLTDTRAFVAVEFQLIVMGHLVNYTVDDVIRVIGDEDIAFTGAILTFLVPA